MTALYNKLYEEPAYGLPEAAVYLKVPSTTLRYWLTGFSKQAPIIEPAECGPVLLSFFPFVVEPRSSEPKTIEINPLVGFGKPIIAGTGISTAIIASRFNARESIAELAEEYGCTPPQIEEAIRWERALPLPVAA